MAFALLKNVLGTGTNIKRGNLNGKLGKALAKIEGNAAAGGFNFSYRDTGLAGAIITCEAGIAGHVSKNKQTNKKSTSQFQPSRLCFCSSNFSILSQ